MYLLNKHIVLGISGGIAAYKTPELVRLFIKEGAQVQVVMTQAATHFVTPTPCKLYLEILSSSVNGMIVFPTGWLILSFLEKLTQL
jgi:hypothetical protein